MSLVALLLLFCCYCCCFCCCDYAVCIVFWVIPNVVVVIIVFCYRCGRSTSLLSSIRSLLSLMRFCGSCCCCSSFFVVIVGLLLYLMLWGKIILCCHKKSCERDRIWLVMTGTKSTWYLPRPTCEYKYLFACKTSLLTKTYLRMLVPGTTCECWY